MKDMILNRESIEGLKVTLEGLAIDIPNIQVRRQTRRKRRARPAAAERFHDLYRTTGHILGEGSHGAVHCYEHMKTGVEYAVKVINKSMDYNRSKILKEIDLFHHCRGHRNIVQLNEFYEEDDKFYLIFDKLQGGTLFDQIQKRGHLTESEASQIIANLAAALDFLHHKGIAHRDLKPENILCASEEDITDIAICDFDLGNAIVVEQDSPVSTPELLTPVGSLEYMAPEVVDAWVGDAFSYNKKCDIWSLGIILYTMLCGYPPFNAHCGKRCGWETGGQCKACQDLLFERIQEGVYYFPPNEWSHISSNAKDLIGHLLVRDPADRYSAHQVLQHAWIQEPAPVTLLATPRVLSRNNSAQRLDAYAEQAMAFNRSILAQLTISESCSSLSSHESDLGFTIVGSAEGPNFMLGDFSDEEEDDESPVKKIYKSESQESVKLSLPSSKLAQRRMSRQM